MKHNLNATTILIAFFLLTQIFGLYLVNQDIEVVQTINETIIIEHKETAIGERPELTSQGSFIYIVTAISIGTLLLLLIIKYNKLLLWKIWFFLAIFLSISIALGVLLDVKLAYLLALILTILKIFKPNIITHNVSEILMYSGLAVLLTPLFHGELFWIIALLILIAIYDAFAVWKSKHMIKIAKFQAKTNLFAGLMIPYENKKGLKISLPEKPDLKQSGKVRNAILGGGDVAFPLIFSGVVMESLIKIGLSPTTAFFRTTIISFVVTLTVFGLFVFAKKNKFYPAMPFITAGCLIGYALVLIF